MALRATTIVALRIEGAGNKGRDRKRQRNRKTMKQKSMQGRKVEENKTVGKAQNKDARGAAGEGKGEKRSKQKRM